MEFEYYINERVKIINNKTGYVIITNAMDKNATVLKQVTETKLKDVNGKAITYQQNMYLIKLDKQYATNKKGTDFSDLTMVDEEDITRAEAEILINGMSPSRYIAACILKDSSFKGTKYYQKEDQLTEKIETALKETYINRALVMFEDVISGRASIIYNKVESDRTKELKRIFGL